MSKILSYKAYFHESSLEHVCDVSSFEPGAKRMKNSDEESTNVNSKDKVNC